MRTLLEFGIKYSLDKQMHVKCEFKQFNTKKQFEISISIILKKNPNFKLDPLEILLREPTEEEKEFENLSFDKQIVSKYS